MITNEHRSDGPLPCPVRPTPIGSSAPCELVRYGPVSRRQPGHESVLVHFSISRFHFAVIRVCLRNFGPPRFGDAGRRTRTDAWRGFKSHTLAGLLFAYCHARGVTFLSRAMLSHFEARLAKMSCSSAVGALFESVAHIRAISRIFFGSSVIAHLPCQA